MAQNPTPSSRNKSASKPTPKTAKTAPRKTRSHKAVADAPTAAQNAKPETPKTGATRSKQSANPSTANAKRASTTKPEPPKTEANEQSGSEFPVPDPKVFANNMLEIAERSQALVKEFLANGGKIDTHPVDPLNVSKAFFELGKAMVHHPATLLEAQNKFWQSQAALWQNTVKRVWGYDTEPMIEVGRDKRFRHEDWSKNAIFDYIKQSYLLTANWLQDTVARAEGIEEKDRQKINFYTKQFADAMAPSNFVMTNPEVLRETLKTNGENLLRGLNNLLEDLESGHGQLSIRQTDMDYFQIGENIALSPGKVVFRNDLMELLQYTPTTDQVYRRPLLIFPPWINKFYILDLQEKSSFIKWAVAQGYTVFVVSWVNPDRRQAQKTFESYMFEGVLAALDAVEQATGEREVNAIGYCIGGTLLGASLAYMKAKGEDRIKSATFFAAQVDFTEAGELQVFIDDEQLHTLEDKMKKAGGYLEGQAMASTFNMLRANDLIWSYVVNNYLLGREPMPFDLLYWNADTTRMPSKMHLFYLRECYLNNRLSKGEMILGDVRVNLHDVDIPVFLQSSKEDHIAPFNSVYKATKIYEGDVRFIVAGSGHIAGVINHPDANKYQYWTNDDVSGTIDDWWLKAEEHKGSWWPYWDKWLSERSGEKIAARTPGEGELEAICDAPGAYVMIKASD